MAQKIVLKAAYTENCSKSHPCHVHCTFSRTFPASSIGGHIEKIAQWQTIIMRLSENSLELVSVFIKQANLYISFQHWPNNLKTTCAHTKNTFLF
jgi:hypothetical protein